MKLCVRNPMNLKPLLPHLSLWSSQLSGPHQPVNTYYWYSPRGLVVIDPAADAPVAPDVVAVFITHVQAENIAGAGRFNAPIYVAAGDAYLCEGPARYIDVITKWAEPWDWTERGNYRGHLAGARNERPSPVPLPVTVAPLPVGEIIETPGHGKQGRTLLVECDGQRVAFCGDLIYGDGQLWNWFDADWDYGPQTGQQALLKSAETLAARSPTWLCPTHGPVVTRATEALQRLQQNLRAVLTPPTEPMDVTPLLINTPPDDTSGFRPILPHLYQYVPNAGNCAALISRDRAALLVDDGLCCWQPLPVRADNHRNVMTALKRQRGLDRIEAVVVTHYHGDHVENIRQLVVEEGAEVIALDVVAEVLEHPEQFNLACMLPWYDVGHDIVPVTRRLTSGTRWRWHEYELEIFHIAGQTYYHAGIQTVVDGQRVIFTGDAFNPWPSVEPVLTYNDNEPSQRGWLYALDRLAERHPDLLVMGHAGAMRQPPDLIEVKRRLWQQQLERYRRLSARPDLRLFFDPFIGANQISPGDTCGTSV